MKKLRFENNTLENIKEQAGKTYPNECCGVLLGSWSENGKTVQKVIPTQNIVKQDEKDKSFRISPLELYKLERIAEEEALEVLGFYHSHPEYEAVLSKEDILHMIPEYSYPIISVKKQTFFEKRYEIRSFTKSFEQKEEIILEEEIECRSSYIYQQHFELL